MRKQHAYHKQQAHRVRRQRGAGLIEVMIAVLVMGVGLLGIAAMQATALRNSQSSLESSQAVIQTYAILDAMRANRDAALGGAYNLAAMTCAVPAAGTLAQSDLNQWVTSLKTSLGSSAADSTVCGQVNCAAGLCTISVQWDDSRASNDNGTGIAAGANKRQVSTVTRL